MIKRMMLFDGSSIFLLKFNQNSSSYLRNIYLFYYSVHG